jgi:hypothetical protein
MAKQMRDFTRDFKFEAVRRIAGEGKSPPKSHAIWASARTC